MATVRWIFFQDRVTVNGYRHFTQGFFHFSEFLDDAKWIYVANNALDLDSKENNFKRRLYHY